jgi:hypothetical protein
MNPEYFGFFGSKSPDDGKVYENELKISREGILIRSSIDSVKQAAAVNKQYNFKLFPAKQDKEKWVIDSAYSNYEYIDGKYVDTTTQKINSLARNNQELIFPDFLSISAMRLQIISLIVY